jgi:hypothetical protein
MTTDRNDEDCVMDKKAAIAEAAQALADAMTAHGGRLELGFSMLRIDRFNRWTYDIKVSEILADAEGSALGGMAR